MSESVTRNKQDEQQDKQQETIDGLKQEMINLKEQIKINNKKQQETTDSLKQEIINLKEQIYNKKQPLNNNSTII